MNIPSNFSCFNTIVTKVSEINLQGTYMYCLANMRTLLKVLSSFQIENIEFTLQESQILIFTPLLQHLSNNITYKDKHCISSY